MLSLNYFDSSPLSLVYYHLLTYEFFFATSHQATITSIQWEAAFIGIRETIPAISAILVTLNSVPGVIVSTSIPLMLKSKYDLNPATSMWSLIWTIFILLTSSMSFILLRHLMIWKIFAPRMLAQFLFSIVAELGLLFVECVSWK